MESIKLSATSVLWKKIQLDFFRALNNKGANPRRTQVFCCCCIYIFKKKTTLTQCPVSLSRMFLSPGNMHNENKARRITTHVTRTPSIYVYNILRENSDEWIFGVHPPPSWFCSKWIIKWNTQPRVVRSTFDMVHWFFSAFFGY